MMPTPITPTVGRAKVILTLEKERSVQVRPALARNHVGTSYRDISITMRNTIHASQAMALTTNGQWGIGGELPTGTEGSSHFPRGFCGLSFSVGMSNVLPSSWIRSVYGLPDATSIVTGISNFSLPAKFVTKRSAVW